MPGSTTNYAFNLPLVNDPIDADLWGGQLNANWSSLDTLLAAVGLKASGFDDGTFRVADNADPSKKVAFELSGLTTATTRTLTIPDVSGTVMVSKNTNANLVYAGPASGGATLPTFRSLVPSDIGSGTPTASTFLRGDGTWNSPFSYAVFCDQKSSGTAGGTFSTGAWRTRDLNTSQFNGISGASISSNQITLPAGTYVINAAVPAFFVNQNQARLQNITDATTALIGTPAASDTNSSGSLGNSVISMIQGIIVIGSPKSFEIQHQCQTTRISDGFGRQGGFGIEQYSTITIQKIA